MDTDLKKDFKWTTKHILAFASLGLAYPSMIGFVCMQYVYYDAMIEVMGITNAQLGFLMTVDAVGALILALPGGMLADKFDCKKVLAWSLAISAVSCVMFALKPTYTMALVVWTITAVTMCGFYGAVYKVVRVMAPESHQGKAYGLFGVCNAAGFIFVNTVALRFYSIYAAKGGAPAGLSAVLIVFTVTMTVGTILGYYFQSRVPNPEKNTTELDSISLDQIKVCLKQPGTYLLFVLVFTAAVLHTTSSYFTPYLTNVIGTTMIASSSFAIIRQYGVRMISSPLGGALADRINSSAKVLTGAFAIAIVGVLMMLFFGTKGLGIAIFFILCIALVDNMITSIEYSVCGEAMIPSLYMGTTTGLVTIILPDLFVPAMYGHWLDKYGNQGYTYIFLFCIFTCVIGATACIVIGRRAKKAKEKTTV